MLIAKKISVIALLCFIMFPFSIIAETGSNQQAGQITYKPGHSAIPDMGLTPPPPPEQLVPRKPVIARAPAKITVLPNEFLSIDVLVVIYTNYILDTVTQVEMTQLINEVTQGEEFFWRNSRGKLDLNISYEIIDRQLILNQFWLVVPPNGYWYPFWEVNGVNSVRNDLYSLGYVDNQFSAVFVYYAWTNTESATAAYGGGAYGVDVGFMGQTAYAAVPLCWDPTTNDWLFVHEFHHCFDDMYRASGLPEYPHADYPISYSAAYDDGYSFNAWMLRTWPGDNWGLMSSSWGDVFSFTDNDNDSLADTDTRLTVTEQSFGSSTGDLDTDSDQLGDLGEFTAGYLLSSNPLSMNTDSSGHDDGADPYPLDPVDNFLTRRNFNVNGTLDPSEMVLLSKFAAPDTTSLRAEAFGFFADSGLYLGFKIHDNMIQHPWTDPWWDDAVYIMIDANNDGYLAHGYDNYSIYVSPRGLMTNPLVNMAIVYPDGTRDENFLPASDLRAVYYYPASPTYYIIEMFLRKSPVTGFAYNPRDTFGLQIEVIDYDTYPGWPHYAAFTQFIDMIYYPCGDASGNGIINILDVTFNIAYLYKGGPAPNPIQAGDASGNGVLNILDVTYLISYLYKGGLAPVCP